jgi:hypothetical protein
MYLIFLQGFTINGRPVLDKFVKVLGGFEASIAARVHSPPTVLLHLRLHSITYVAHFTMVEDLLAEYYSAGNKLKVLDLPFNVREDKATAEWSKDAAKLISELSGFRHVVVFVTTHSVPDNGDLWLGNDRSNKPCAALVDNMSANLFYHFILIFTVSLAVAKCYFATIWANS